MNCIRYTGVNYLKKNAREGRIYLVWGFEKSVNSGDLIDERYILSECEMRGSGRLGEIGAVEWIGII